MSGDDTIEARIAEDDGLTIRDEHGASLVVERWDGDEIAVWIAAPGENDGRSVWLTPEDRRRLAAYLLGGAA